ncbi:MAG TPA: GNAT family N-acetyltransferase [Beijerinckiaceae bacterium]|jgi:putative acetyltransferase
MPDIRTPAPHAVHLHDFLRPDHWDVADLWVANWGAEMPQMGFDARHEWLFEHLEDLHEKGGRTICAVNLVNGVIAGFVTLDPDGRRLERIVVAASARGSGVGAKLLDEAKRASPQGLIAEVEPGAARALRFFEREGFERRGQGASGATRLVWRG